jgi:hypothetical protein
MVWSAWNRATFYTFDSTGYTDYPFSSDAFTPAASQAELVSN